MSQRLFTDGLFWSIINLHKQISMANSQRPTHYEVWAGDKANQLDLIQIFRVKEHAFACAEGCYDTNNVVEVIEDSEETT